MSGVTHITVAADEGEQRLDRWLRRRHPHLTQGAVEKMLRRGEIRVDGGRAKAAHRVKPGEVIRIPPIRTAGPPPAAAAEDAPPPSLILGLKKAVLYQDDDLIVLDKPHGLAVQGGSGQSHHVDGLARHLVAGGADAPRLVHRLDRDTSGLIVLACTRDIAARLSRAFRGRSVAKTYFAAVAGRPSPAAGRIDFYLVKAPDGAGQEKMRCLASAEAAGFPGAQSARTDYATIAAAGKRAAWLALRPVTGRTHQLRAHLAAIGCPILGDGKYGGRERVNEGSGWGAGAGSAISRRLHLHAAALAFAHPRTGSALHFRAPLPGHMRATWDFFEWDEADGAADPFAED